MLRDRAPVTHLPGARVQALLAYLGDLPFVLRAATRDEARAIVAPVLSHIWIKDREPHAITPTRRSLSPIQIVALPVYWALYSTSMGSTILSADRHQHHAVTVPHLIVKGCDYAHARFLLSCCQADLQYRRVSNRKQRQQTRWVVCGIAAALMAFLGIGVALSIVAPTPSSATALAMLMVGVAITYLALLLIPLSIGVAMLRYHLFDVDVLINRTMVYGALTACIIGLYVLVVGLLGALFQVSGNLAISLLATGLVAVLFQPLREWLQRGVNHLLYGERDEPYIVLARLGQRLEATPAPDAVLPTIIVTIAQALKLPYAAIVLDQDGRWVTAASVGTPLAHPIDLPLVYQGTPIGQLVLGPLVGWYHLGWAGSTVPRSLCRCLADVRSAFRWHRDLGPGAR